MEQRWCKQRGRGLSLSECLRWYPGVRGLRRWAYIRMGVNEVSSGAMYLPAYFRDMRATRMDLSERCLALLMPKLAEFEAQGFRLASFIRDPPHLIPSLHDGGGCWLLHASDIFMGTLLYHKSYLINLPTGPKEVLTLGVGYRLESGRRVGITNNRKRFDTRPGGRTVFVDSSDPADLFSTADVLLRQQESSDPPVRISSLDEMARLKDSESEERLGAWLEKGLFAPMTDVEVEAARKRFNQRGAAPGWPS